MTASDLKLAVVKDAVSSTHTPVFLGLSHITAHYFLIHFAVETHDKLLATVHFNQTLLFYPDSLLVPERKHKRLISATKEFSCWRRLP